ncbi:MAG: orc1/cdc6 family replication initiation protein [Nanoarchaeota archaeon]
MAEVTELDKIFETFDKNVIFKNKSILQNNYQPKEILYRDEQIKQIASMLAPVLRGEKPSNLFLYGKTGTGKTLSIQYVREELMKRVNKELGFNLRIEYLNCKLKKVSDTEYRILAEIIKKFGGQVPATGLPTESVYNKFIELIDSEKQLVILILDEIDQTIKKISDGFLYNLTRLNSELSKTQICIVGISNDLTFLEGLDPRVRSSLSEEEIIFPPYNALQLQDILKKRADGVFKEGVVHEGVIEKCAAFAAREHGDARRALDLLRIAGELAERDGSKKILLKHIDEANSKIERDKIIDVVRTEPKQFQVVLSSIITLSEKNNPQKRLTERNGEHSPVFTGEIYNLYQELCIKNKFEVLTQRRVSDIIQEFDMLGIINVRVISRGRGGRMREIKLAITRNIVDKVKEVIKNSLNYG